HAPVVRAALHRGDGAGGFAAPPARAAQARPHGGAAPIEPRDVAALVRHAHVAGGMLQELRGGTRRRRGDEHDRADAGPGRPRGALLSSRAMIELQDKPAARTDVDTNVRELDLNGITACKQAFSREWVEALREDMMTAFWEAIQRPGGAVGRGPRRWYVEAH